MNITNVHYCIFNGKDDLYFDVDVSIKELLNTAPVFEASKEAYVGEPEEGTFFCKIWACGLATFGFRQKHDPLHGNHEYIWSSNTTTINEEFNLFDTSLELARYGCGVRDNADGCVHGLQLTVALAMQLAKANVDKLNFGLEAYKDTVNSRL